MIKRLYLTEASDSSLSSTQLLLNTNELTGNGDENCSEALKQRYQDICNKVQELKAELNDKKDSLTCKSKTIEQVGFRFKLNLRVLLSIFIIEREKNQRAGRVDEL